MLLIPYDDDMRTTLTTPNISAVSVWLDLAQHIAVDGIACHEEEVRAILGSGGASDRNPTLARLICDPEAPAIARERAFGRLTPPSDAIAPVTGIGIPGLGNPVWVEHDTPRLAS
jgi:hypothetical protein